MKNNTIHILLFSFLVVAVNRVLAVDECGSGNKGILSPEFEVGVKAFNQKINPLGIAKIKINLQMKKAKGYAIPPTDAEPVTCEEKEAGYRLKIGTRYLATIEIAKNVDIRIKPGLMNIVNDLNRQTQHEVAVEQLSKQIIQRSKNSKAGRNKKQSIDNVVHFENKCSVKIEKNYIVILNDKRLDAPQNAELKKEIVSIIDETNMTIQTKLAEIQILAKVKTARSLKTPPTESKPLQASFTYFNEKVPIKIFKEESQYSVEINDDKLTDSNKISDQKCSEILESINSQLSKEE